MTLPACHLAPIYTVTSIVFANKSVENCCINNISYIQIYVNYFQMCLQTLNILVYETLSPISVVDINPCAHCRHRQCSKFV